MTVANQSHRSHPQTNSRKERGFVGEVAAVLSSGHFANVSSFSKRNIAPLSAPVIRMAVERIW